MTNKHTPGPWQFIGKEDAPDVLRGSNGRSVLEADGYAGDVWLSVHKDDARLIAAAPELLEALKESLAALEWVFEQGGGPACEHDGGVVCFCKENNAINSARAAISKAIEQ